MNNYYNLPTVPHLVQQKLCPLLTRSTGEPTNCQGMYCAWWRTTGECRGACALLDIARSLD